MTLLLEVRNLRKSFGGLTVTDDVSLSLAPGSRTALIGPNGAGKTTLVNLVTGHLKPSSGAVLVSGEDVTRAPAVARVAKGLVRTFQVTRLFPDMTPDEHVAMAILEREGRSGRMTGHFRAMPAVMTETMEHLGLLGLAEVATRPVSEIAYGQQRLLELAIALALRPKVLLLDEPAAGVPQNDTPRIEAALARLPADLAVLMIEHDMDLVFRFATHVVVLAEGRVIFAGTPAEVGKDPKVRAAYLGSYGHDRQTA